MENDISTSSIDKPKVSNTEFGPENDKTNPPKNTNKSTSEDINNDINLNIMNLINEMPFENLNDYYDIETSLFLKRIEKLNLKFYWTSECVLNQQDIKYPYNKLFLILFKEISLYMEEISRLNKQLKQKTKSEKYYQTKIALLKQKEKENILNKQMLKNLQRDNRLLEKKNEKNKIEIEKLTKKLANILNDNVPYKHSNNASFGVTSPKLSNITNDNVTYQGSVISNKSNQISDMSPEKYAINVRKKNNNKRNSNSIDHTKQRKNSISCDKNNDIVNRGIEQCDEELENLQLMEDILNNFKNGHLISANSFTNSGKTNNIAVKKDNKQNKYGNTYKKTGHKNHKSDDFSGH